MRGTASGRATMASVPRTSVAPTWLAVGSQRWAAAEAVAAGGLGKLAKKVQNGDPHRKRKGNWWCCNGTPRQADLSLEKGDTNINQMFKTSQGHPLVVIDTIEGGALANWLMVDTKVNAQSKPSDHESVYNIRCSTVMGR